MRRRDSWERALCIIRGESHDARPSPFLVSCRRRGAAPWVASPGWSQTYPTKPVRFIVPLAAGGGTDFLARLVGEYLSRSFGQQVLVENRTGAGGTIGTEAAAKSPPDGYTVLISNDNIASAPHILKVNGDYLKDNVPVIQIARQPLVWAVHHSLNLNTLAEFIAAMKQRPGQGYATSGVGSNQHFLGEWFAKSAGIKLEHVPYRGAGQAVNDMVAGHVPIGTLGPTSMMPHYEAKTLRFLAQSSEARSPTLPEVPTFQESGFKGCQRVASRSANTDWPSCGLSRGCVSRQQHRRGAARAVQIQRGSRRLPTGAADRSEAEPRAHQSQHRAFQCARSAGAQREAKSALTFAPDAPQPYYILGLIAKLQSRPEEAVAAFQRVLKIDPNDVGTNINLGQIYSQQRKYPEAIAAFRVALAAEPYNATALYNLGQALMRAGQRDEGQKVTERFQELRERGSATTIGQNYLEQGRYAEAVASTGAESELVDRAIPAVTFTDASCRSARFTKHARVRSDCRSFIAFLAASSRPPS